MCEEFEPRFTVSELSASKCVCSSFCVFVLFGLGYWVFVTCFLWFLLYCGKWLLQAWICRRTRFYSHLLELGQFSSKQIELRGWWYLETVDVVRFSATQVESTKSNESTQQIWTKGLGRQVGRRDKLAILRDSGNWKPLKLGVVGAFLR
jgi:hypothetical protein